MTSDVRVDRTDLAHLLHAAQVQDALDKLCDNILDDGRRNIVEKGAVETRTLLRSGRTEVIDDGVGRRVGFETPYAHVVHDGLGRGRNDPPRPFLTEAALRNRGVLNGGQG
jgi:hypothetical protein